MVHPFLLGLLAANPSQAQVDAWGRAFSSQVGERPAQLSVKGVSAERTIAEFMDVCVRPAWSLERFQGAIEASDFAYAQQHVDQNAGSFTWSSPRAFLVLNISPMFSECALSIGSIQPRTGAQILAMLKLAVEAELGHAVTEEDHGFYLQWTDPDSGYLDRITLAGATSEPKQAIWYLFDKTAPGVREKLDSLAQPSKPPSE